MSDVVVLKLISGEEIIAECKIDDMFYVVKAPRKVVLVNIPGPENNVAPRLVPWIISNMDGVYPIHSSHVLTVGEKVHEKLVAKYRDEISPIALPPSAASQIVT